MSELQRIELAWPQVYLLSNLLTSYLTSDVGSTRLVRESRRFRCLGCLVTEAWIPLQASHNLPNLGGSMGGVWKVGR